MREVHLMPTIDVTLAQLNGAKVFSKLDTNSGFWQVPLAKESRLLTTFITPQGRFCFNKLPFGITSAQEHFQRRMKEILDDIPGVACHINDILVSGRDQEEHNDHLNTVLKKIQAAGLTINKDKCHFSCSRIVFLGHVIDANGVSPDPHKTEAIQKMKFPTTVTELRRFMGMINQLNKFSPHIAEMSQPLCELLKSNSMWVWTPNHEEAFGIHRFSLTIWRPFDIVETFSSILAAHPFLQNRTVLEVVKEHLPLWDPTSDTMYCH